MKRRPRMHRPIVTIKRARSARRNPYKFYDPTPFQIKRAKVWVTEPCLQEEDDE